MYGSRRRPSDGQLPDPDVGVFVRYSWTVVFYIHICLHFPAFYIWTHLSDSLLKILLLPVFFSLVVSVGRIVLSCLFLWCWWCALDVILSHDYSFCISNLISGLGASLCFVFPADIAKMKKKNTKRDTGECYTRNINVCICYYQVESVSLSI